MEWKASGEILKSNSNSTLEEFSPPCVHEQYVNYLRKLVLAYPDIKKVRKTEQVCQDVNQWLFKRVLWKSTILPKYKVQGRLCTTKWFHCFYKVCTENCNAQIWKLFYYILHNISLVKELKKEVQPIRYKNLAMYIFLTTALVLPHKSDFHF